MSDQAALYGLIGAIAGATLGGGAAVIGPLVLHRRQASERAAQAVRIEQRERELAEREEEWRQRQFQQEVNRERKADHEALVRRLINVRASTRNYSEFLTKIHRTLSEGGQVGLEDFEAELAAVHTSMNSAFDEVLLDGIWFAHAGAASFLNPRGSMLAATGGAGTPQAQRIDATALGHSLISAIDSIKSSIKGGRPIPEDSRRETERALEDVTAARDELVVYLKGRIDAQWVE
ncbi:MULTISPECIES: hypothetical protein [unclassified Streptomyces]|uniref:hypothetical protein n=1 Tax=unclassified Streptomyces TaxID=2593676 RepID=UPI0035E22092